MNPKHLPQIESQNGSAVAVLAREELPLTVRDAAVYLGVSVQTVYLWVERKQIPHLRVMGRNIRFLRSELEPFRAKFKQEVVEWQDR
jgi:excisionase family DNA binding protein